MVYESDFYTTRRPYSRPLVSSYSVTDRPITLPLSSILQLRTYPHMPYIAHKRLVTIVHTPIHTVYHAGALIPVRVHARVRPSVLAAELYRIRNLPRPSSVSYLEKYLNSRDHIYFDDEAKEIRARVDSLMRRVHVFVPRAVSSDFAEEIVPERMRSGDYVRRLISGKSNAKKDVDTVPWYEIPERGNFSNLACVKYVAGKPQSVRKPYYKVSDLHASDIRNDVNFLSYYSKNRQAAATASPAQPMTERELRKARALEPDSNVPVQRKAPKVEKEPEVKQEKKRGSRREAEQAPKAEVVSKPVKQPEPVKEPVKEPEPEPEPEPAKELEAIVEAEKEPEPVPEPVKEPEPVPEPVKEPEPVPEPIKEPEPVPEPIKEPEPVPEPVKEPEPVPEPIKEPEPVPEPEPVKEPEPVPEPIKEPEPVSEPIKEPEEVKVETESVKEENVPEPEVSSEPQPTENADSTSKTEEADEEKQGGKDVKQDRLNAMQRIEKYLVKTADEVRTAEQKTEAYEQEKVKLELDELKAWEALQIAAERTAQLDEILELEQAVAERQEEEVKIEIQRKEEKRLEEAEREIAEAHVAALLEEQARMVVEEKVSRKVDQEERLADVAFDEIEETREVEVSREDQVTVDYMDQDREEKAFELMNDDDTRIEEENPADDDHNELPEDDPFAEEPDAGECKPESGPNAIDESPMVEEVTSGGEESFEWGDEDA